MKVTATHITYYHLCHRKLWLLEHEIRMEWASDTVSEGKFISDTAYSRRPKRWIELDLGFLKIDHYDPHQKLVREVKKSPKLEHAHVAQVQYYLYALEQAGVKGVRGLLEYPKQRRTREVYLTESVRNEIPGWEAEIERIVQQDTCPPLVRKSICKRCAFFYFCYAGEA
jgi:CRISPR-associated exonuclease Cas4